MSMTKSFELKDVATAKAFVEEARARLEEYAEFGMTVFGELIETPLQERNIGRFQMVDLNNSVIRIRKVRTKLDENGKPTNQVEVDFDFTPRAYNLHLHNIEFELKPRAMISDGARAPIVRFVTIDAYIKQ